MYFTIHSGFRIIPGRLYDIGNYGFLIPTNKKSSWFSQVNYVTIEGKEYYINRRVI